MASLDEDEFITVDPVDKPVLLVDATGPEPGEVAGEAFGLAGPDVPVCLAVDAAAAGRWCDRAPAAVEKWDVRIELGRGSG